MFKGQAGRSTHSVARSGAATSQPCTRRGCAVLHFSCWGLIESSAGSRQVERQSAQDEQQQRERQLRMQARSMDVNVLVTW